MACAPEQDSNLRPAAEKAAAGPGRWLCLRHLGSCTGMADAGDQIGALHLAMANARRAETGDPLRAATPRLRAPGRTRTCGRLLRRQLLYPAELQAPGLIVHDGGRTLIPVRAESAARQPSRFRRRRCRAAGRGSSPDGLSPGQFFGSEVSGPLDADFHIGLPESQLDRCSDCRAPAVGGRAGGDCAGLRQRAPSRAGGAHQPGAER